MIEMIFFRCNRNGEKPSVSNSSGTMSKTSDIGVGTVELTTRTNEDHTNNYLSPMPPQNNDTITIISSVSENSDDNSKTKTDNEYDTQSKTNNATITSDLNEDNISMKELSICNQGDRTNLGANNDKVVSNTICNGISGAYNQVSNDNHTNDAFIDEEKQT